jgi:hypothetical protein
MGERAYHPVICRGHGQLIKVVYVACQQCWEACWGQPLKSSNLSFSALLTRRPPAAKVGRILCTAAVAGVMIVV